MPAQALGNPWGSQFTVQTDNGPVGLQGFDNGVVITTPEAPVEGWSLAHVTDDPAGDPDVIYVAGRKFRSAPE